jgi:hypothetical protein
MRSRHVCCGEAMELVGAFGVTWMMGLKLRGAAVVILACRKCGSYYFKERGRDA